MEARIRKDRKYSYIGEVYGTWENLILGTEWTGWERVTSRCMTEQGARRELKKWKEKNYPTTFEL